MAAVVGSPPDRHRPVLPSTPVISPVDWSNPKPIQRLINPSLRVRTATPGTV